MNNPERVCGEKRARSSVCGDTLVTLSPVFVDALASQFFKFPRVCFCVFLIKLSCFVFVFLDSFAC